MSQSSHPTIGMVARHSGPKVEGPERLREVRGELVARRRGGTVPAGAGAAAHGGER